MKASTGEKDSGAGLVDPRVQVCAARRVTTRGQRLPRPAYHEGPRFQMPVFNILNAFRRADICPEVFSSIATRCSHVPARRLLMRSSLIPRSPRLQYIINQRVIPRDGIVDVGGALIMR